MIYVSLNICSEQGPMNWVPISWQFENAREFTQFIRKNIIRILNWGHEHSVPKSHLRLAFNIIEPIQDDEDQWSWNFTIPIGNIREAKPYINLSRSDFEIVLREVVIEDLLD